MTKKVFITAFLMLALTNIYGCSNPVRYTVSERYSQMRPYSVAVPPAVWDSPRGNSDYDISRLFTEMSVERLKSMNYNPVPLEGDGLPLQRTIATGTGGKRADEAKRTPKEIASKANADAVLIIRITGWESRKLITYYSLDAAATFELYSRHGELLWQARYRTNESDMRLDTKSVELAVIKAYEPRIQRLVDSVFSTLPQGTAPARERTYYQWLP